MSEIVSVPFLGDSIVTLVTHQGEFIPLKPLCERFGLSWQPQHRKLTQRSELWGVTMLMIPSAGGEQATLCLPVNRVAMWLASINPVKVSPNLRPLVEDYQRYAADVLDRFFRLRAFARDVELTELRAQLEETEQERARCAALALAFNSTFSRIANLQRAGVPRWQASSFMRMAHDRASDIIQNMEDIGVIRYHDWADADAASKRHLARRDGLVVEKDPTFQPLTGA